MLEALQEVIDARNTLMAELNAGFYDGEAWDALYILARDNGCENIAAQVWRYIERYG